MEQLFVKAWQRQAIWLWLLLPLSWIYRLISRLNKTLYKLGLKKIYYAKVPVIVIGNITVGGSGKTPLIIALVQYLQSKNIKIAVISRGYGGDTTQMPLLVTKQSTPKLVGDEPCLIVQTTNVLMTVSPNRGQAIELLLKNHPDIQLILADDGLQHYALDRDENWIVIDAERGFGNKQVLPVGFLREPITRLFQPNTSVIFHQADWQRTNKTFEDINSLSKNNKIPNDLCMRLVEKPIRPLFVDENNSSFLDLKQSPNIIAMTGIGYPKRFFNSLSKLGFNIITKPFNDHHDYSLNDFKDLPELPIIVTTKDAVKIRILLQNELASDESNRIAQAKQLKLKIWVLPVIAELSPSVYAKIDEQLLNLI